MYSGLIGSVSQVPATGER